LGTESSVMAESERLFAKRFAKIGFLLGGVIPFYFGYQAFNPPPPPPGTAYCGGSVLAGLCVMVFGTPFGALVGALLAWLIGVSLDSARLTLSHPERSRDQS